LPILPASGTILTTDQAPLLFESRRAAVEGLVCYERASGQVLRDAEVYESPATLYDAYVVCGYMVKGAGDAFAGCLEQLDHARQSLDTWIEMVQHPLIGGGSARLDKAREEAQ
jgi:hypothetical protein